MLLASRVLLAQATIPAFAFRSAGKELKGGKAKPGKKGAAEAPTSSSKVSSAALIDDGGVALSRTPLESSPYEQVHYAEEIGGPETLQGEFEPEMADLLLPEGHPAKLRAVELFTNPMFDPVEQRLDDEMEVLHNIKKAVTLRRRKDLRAAALAAPIGIGRQKAPPQNVMHQDSFIDPNYIPQVLADGLRDGFLHPKGRTLAWWHKQQKDRLQHSMNPEAYFRRRKDALAASKRRKSANEVDDPYARERDSDDELIGLDPQQDYEEYDTAAEQYQEMIEDNANFWKGVPQPGQRFELRSRTIFKKKIRRSFNYWRSFTDAAHQRFLEQREQRKSKPLITIPGISSSADYRTHHNMQVAETLIPRSANDQPDDLESLYRGLRSAIAEPSNPEIRDPLAPQASELRLDRHTDIGRLYDRLTEQSGHIVYDAADKEQKEKGRFIRLPIDKTRRSVIEEVAQEAIDHPDAKLPLVFSTGVDEAALLHYAIRISDWKKRRQEIAVETLQDQRLREEPVYKPEFTIYSTRRLLAQKRVVPGYTRKADAPTPLYTAKATSTKATEAFKRLAEQAGGDSDDGYFSGDEDRYWLESEPVTDPHFVFEEAGDERAHMDLPIPADGYLKDNGEIVDLRRLLQWQYFGQEQALPQVLLPNWELLSIVNNGTTSARDIQHPPGPGGRPAPFVPNVFEVIGAGESVAEQKVEIQEQTTIASSFAASLEESDVKLPFDPDFPDPQVFDDEQVTHASASVQVPFKVEGGEKNYVDVSVEQVGKMLWDHEAQRLKKRQSFL